MAIISPALAVSMFLGITLLAQAYHVTPSDTETVVSQLARGVFSGHRNFPPTFSIRRSESWINFFIPFASLPSIPFFLARSRISL